jgi:hypothetical protein
MAIGFAFIAAGLWIEEDWDDTFTLALNVSSLSGKPIDSVSYATCAGLKEAKALASGAANEADSAAFKAAANENNRFTADVRCSGKRCLFKIETQYTEPRYVVIRAKHDDGKELRRLKEIPAGRGPRSVSIAVP